jgi:hypothetical protein
VPHVGVGLVAQARDQLAVVRRAQALGMADHVAEPDVEATAEELGEPQRGPHLTPVAEHFSIREAGVLDSDCRPVEADRVAAPDPCLDEAEDRAPRGDDEMRADVGELVQLRVANVWGERVEDPARGADLGDVLDDHPRVTQAPAAFAVVAGAVGRGLALALGAEGDRPGVDRRVRRVRGRRDREQGEK